MQKQKNTVDTQKTMEYAKVIRQDELTEDIYSVWLETKAAEEAKAGQFVSLYTGSEAHLLPRPISICEVKKDVGQIRLVYRVLGRGTKEFSKIHSDETIKMLGPLGNGYEAIGNNVLLLGGGIGIPPMLELARAFAAGQNQKPLPKEKIQVVLGYRDQDFLKEEFQQYATVYTSSDDGSIGTRGTVLDAVRENHLEADVVYACGPKPMLSAVKDYAERKKLTCFVSMEERMACGVGACLGCVVETVDVDDHSKVHNARVCKDGPVFNAAYVRL